jgi:hypothetical protein
MDVDCNYKTLDSVQCWAFVNTTMKFRVLRKRVFLEKLATTTFSRRTLLHGVIYHLIIFRNSLASNENLLTTILIEAFKRFSVVLCTISS